MNSDINIEYIGVILTPFNSLEGMPIQPKGASQTKATIVLDKKYLAGLKDLDKFSHIYLIYHFHKTTKTELEVIPFMDTEPRGVFSTRSPLRPSHIGMSLTKILSIKDNTITIEGIDVLNHTPLLDIKPYIPQFEMTEDVKTGWMEANEEKVKATKSDNRFV